MTRFKALQLFIPFSGTDPMWRHIAGLRERGYRVTLSTPPPSC